jgi:hypothetical protein
LWAQALFGLHQQHVGVLGEHGVGDKDHGKLWRVPAIVSLEPPVADEVSLGAVSIARRIADDALAMIVQGYAVPLNEFEFDQTGLDGGVQQCPLDLELAHIILDILGGHNDDFKGSSCQCLDG